MRSRFAAWNLLSNTSMTVITLIRFAGMSFMTLIPAFARDILDVGPQGQGLLTTAGGIGALAGAFFIAAAGDRLPKGKIMLAGGILYGLGELAFGNSHWFVPSVLLMLGLGLTGVSCTTLVNTVLQRAAAPEMRGRVMSMFQQSQISYITGGVAIGAVAEVLGPAQATMLMGAVCALGFAAMAITMADIRAVRQ